MASHGTKRKYDQERCRCDACRAWKRSNAEARRANLKARIAANDPTLIHGTVLYGKGGCRCSVCVEGRAEDQRQRYWANPAADAESRRRWREKHPDRARTYAQEQAALIGSAPKSGDIWTGAELEIVVTRTDLTLTDLAKRLGRTRAGVISARHRATHDPKWIRVVGTSGQIAEG